MFCSCRIFIAVRVRVSVVVVLKCREERKKWIIAKYVDHAFAIPSSLELEQHALVKQRMPSMSSDDEAGSLSNTYVLHLRPPNAKHVSDCLP